MARPSPLVPHLHLLWLAVRASSFVFPDVCVRSLYSLKPVAYKTRFGKCSNNQTTSGDVTVQAEEPTQKIWDKRPTQQHETLFWFCAWWNTRDLNRPWISRPPLRRGTQPVELCVKRVDYQIICQIKPSCRRCLHRSAAENQVDTLLQTRIKWGSVQIHGRQSLTWSPTAALSEYKTVSSLFCTCCGDNDMHWLNISLLTVVLNGQTRVM